MGFDFRMVSEPRARLRLACAVSAALLLLCSCSGHDDDEMRQQPSGAASPASEPADADADAVWLTRECTASLAESIRALRLDVSEQGPTVSVAGKRISVAARITGRVRMDDKSVLAAKFDILIDGVRVPSLTSATTGLDATRAAARTTAAYQWAQQYGTPIAFALAAQLGPTGTLASTKKSAALRDATLDIDEYVIFHGPPGLRSLASTPENASFDAITRAIAAAVVPYWRHSQSAGEFRSGTITLEVEGTTAVSGECRVDGAVSAGLFRDVAKMTWPEAAPTYIIRLFFVGIRRDG